jgi:hydroxymethylpyrimidine pyrophosphatase-like HAD family hydrolase
MRYHALACDYDGTIARHGHVAAETYAALERVRQSGRRLVLVTGRILDDLMTVFPEAGLFHRIVAENGAVLFDPAAHKKTLLATPPPPELARRLARRGVTGLGVGDVIVATWQPHEKEVLETIHEMGLELQIVFNRDAVMVLPSGVNKATGLRHALADLKLSPHNAVSVGDAENDHALLALCECGVAVGDAIPSLRAAADWTTAGANGDGACELMDALVEADLSSHSARGERHALPIGTAMEDGRTLNVAPYGENLLVAGSSGSGKSTFVTAFVETLAARGYQFCIVDPEGDYESTGLATALGDHRRAPRVEEVVKVLDTPAQSVAVNMIGVALPDRPAFFTSLLPRLQALRSETGRPHWIVIDETHHLLPESWDKSGLTTPLELRGLLLVTVHPDRVSTEILQGVHRIAVFGTMPRETLARFARQLGYAPPEVSGEPLPSGEGLLWQPGAAAPVRFRAAVPESDRRRHVRKYAEGELPPERSFYFKGPQGKLNLRAQNLQLFLQLADGVDDATWTHHLRRGDYSRWFREMIKDDGMADAAAGVESESLPPRESRERIRALIEERYTAPA